MGDATIDLSDSSLASNIDELFQSQQLHFADKIAKRVLFSRVTLTPTLSGSADFGSSNRTAKTIWYRLCIAITMSYLRHETISFSQTEYLNQFLYLIVCYSSHVRPLVFSFKKQTSGKIYQEWRHILVVGTFNAVIKLRLVSFPSQIAYMNHDRTRP